MPSMHMLKRYPRRNLGGQRKNATLNRSRAAVFVFRFAVRSNIWLIFHEMRMSLHIALNRTNQHSKRKRAVTVPGARK